MIIIIRIYNMFRYRINACVKYVLYLGAESLRKCAKKLPRTCYLRENALN